MIYAYFQTELFILPVISPLISCDFASDEFYLLIWISVHCYIENVVASINVRVLYIYIYVYIYIVVFYMKCLKNSLLPAMTVVLIYFPFLIISLVIVRFAHYTGMIMFLTKNLAAKEGLHLLNSPHRQPLRDWGIIHFHARLVFRVGRRDEKGMSWRVSVWAN